MIPNSTGTTVTKNLPGKSVKWDFAPGAGERLMNVLIRQYSDHELAVIREYSTNARDSHIEAGQQNPIEVFTPTPLSPYLRIKDYGVGMSVDDVCALFSQFGGTTKRGSNAVTGMLGIGSKSALAYASQFTVACVKDGVRVLVAASRDEDGSASSTIVDTCTTDEPNGVEVSIPARGGNQILRKAERFFSFWPDGSVLLNGKPPKRPEQALKITDSLYLVQDPNRDGSVVVMGNIPYPCPKLSSGSLNLYGNIALIAHVPIGAVDFAPSREALEYTPHTERAINAIVRDFEQNIAAAISRAIAGAPTTYEAVDALDQWGRLIGRYGRYRGAAPTYKGQAIPDTLKAPPGGSMAVTDAGSYGMASVHRTAMFDLGATRTAVFITGFDPVNLTRTHKLKMIQHLGKNSPGRVTKFVLVNFPLDKTWLDPARIWRWEDVKAEVLPKRPKPVTAGRLTGSYDVVERKAGEREGRAKCEVLASDIDQTAPLYYIHGNFRKGRQYGPVLDALHPAYTLLCLPSNRIEKFKRDHPRVVQADSAIKDAVKAWTKNLSNDERLGLLLSDNGLMTKYRNFSNHVDLSKIADPAVKEAVRLAKLDLSKAQKARAAFRHFAQDVSLEATWDNPLAPYQLLPEGYLLRRASVEHIISYMNHVYRTEAKK